MFLMYSTPNTTQELNAQTDTHKDSEELHIDDSGKEGYGDKMAVHGAVNIYDKDVYDDENMYDKVVYDDYENVCDKVVYDDASNDEMVNVVKDIANGQTSEGEGVRRQEGGRLGISVTANEETSHYIPMTVDARRTRQHKAMASKEGQSAATSLEAGKLVHEGRDRAVRSTTPAKPRKQDVRIPDRPTRVQINMHAYMYPNAGNMPSTAYMGHVEEDDYDEADVGNIGDDTNGADTRTASTPEEEEVDSTEEQNCRGFGDCWGGRLVLVVLTWEWRLGPSVLWASGPGLKVTFLLNEVMLWASSTAWRLKLFSEVVVVIMIARGEVLSYVRVNVDESGDMSVDSMEVLSWMRIGRRYWNLVVVASGFVEVGMMVALAR
eukprot:gene7485-15324_t